MHVTYWLVLFLNIASKLTAVPIMSNETNSAHKTKAEWKSNIGANKTKAEWKNTSANKNKAASDPKQIKTVY